MRVFWVITSQLLLLSCIALFVSKQIFAINSAQPVELTVPATTIEVSGFVARSSLVTIELNGVIVGTATPDSAGAFSKVLTVVSPGVAKISVSYEVQGRTSLKQTKSVSVQPQQQTEVEFLPAPILFTNSPINPAVPQNIAFHGFAPPSSTVTLQSSTGVTLQTLTNSSGKFTFTVNSSQFSIGEVIFKAQVQLAGVTSAFSRNVAINFRLPPPQIATDEPDIIVNPNQPVTPVVSFPNVQQTRINGNTVTFSGQAQPGLQIIMYVNGQVAGSVFVNENGEWEISYQSFEERALFQFSSCDGQSCSLPSETIEVEFKLVAGVCEVDFKLDIYRFWDISERLILLTSDSYPFDALVSIDWGDGVSEQFSYDANDDFSYAYTYKELGQYNGSVLLTLSDECELRRYFSVQIDDQGDKTTPEFNAWRNLIILFVVLTPISFGFYRHSRL